MRWFHSNPGPAFAQGHAAPTSTPRETTEQIRIALLAALQGTPAQASHNLVLRIRHATDPQVLWYLRPELMRVLAASQGEARARQILARISPLFHDVLPDGLASQLRAAAPDHGAAAARRTETTKETA